MGTHYAHVTEADRLSLQALLQAKLGALIAALPPTVIGMEACSGAHHWARLFQAHGHTVRLMAPAYFSDRGRLFQSDRGRRNGSVEGAPG